MGEVTRFRVVRAPRRLAEDARAVLRVLEPGTTPTPFLTALRQLIAGPPALVGAARGRRNVAAFTGGGGGGGGAAAMIDTALLDLAASVRAERAAAPAPTVAVQQVDRFIEQFNEELLRRPMPTAARCGALMSLIAKQLDLGIGTPAGDVTADDVIGLPGWDEARSRAGDDLMSAVMLSSLGEAPQPGTSPEELTRRMLVIGLIEGLSDPLMGIVSSGDVSELLFNRTVLLPSPPFPLRKFVPLVPIARYARKPGIMDLEVIRDEWSCFIPGEIAFIENVMVGEKKFRTHKRVDEIETTTSREETGTTTQEQASQTADRFQFEEEARRETSVAVTVNAQVDVSASYGAVKIEASAGANASLSFEDSSTRSTQTAKEIVQRALSRVESQVRELRATRTLFRSSDRDHHEFDNQKTGATNVSGMYRWVDKVKRLRSFTYPMRYLLEFELAEPGARLRWLRARRKLPEGLVPKPPAFTEDGEPGTEGDFDAMLSPAQISRDNYTRLVGLFRAQGVKEPPADEVDVAGAIQLTLKATQPQDTYDLVAQIPAGQGTINLAVPPGYKATLLRAAMVAAPQLAKWRDVPGPTANGYTDEIGYHRVVAAITAGNARLTLHNGVPTVFNSPAMAEGYDYRDAWAFNNSVYEGEVTLNQDMVGQVTVGATLAGTFTGHITVSLKAVLLDSAFEQWQLDTFDQLHQAYQNWKTQYDSEQQAREVASGPAITGDSPSKNRTRVIEEIKRQVIELLMGGNFAGYSLLTEPTPAFGPTPDLSVLDRATPAIQFIEQAFEWNNITYVTYPFYWTDRDRWTDLEELRSTDPDFESFLRAGSARIVVPARPGYQFAVEYFATFGAPWSGGAAPAPDEALYISVAQEIRSLTGAPDDGVPGEMWEVKQPTTLVWLDNDSALPKKNDAMPSSFVGTASPKICPD